MDEALKWDGQTVVDIYQKGIAGGFKNEIVELTIEAYQSLESGFRLSPIILSGEALHRLNCEIILQYAKDTGSIEYVFDNKRKFVILGNNVKGNYVAAMDLIDKITLRDTIYFLKENKIISEKNFLEMHALRHLRNSAVHKIHLPRIEYHDPKISLTKEEIINAVFKSLGNEKLPLNYYQYEFDFEIRKGEKRTYIVDQEKLRIDIKAAISELWISTISVAILLSIFRDVNSIMPLKIERC